MPTVHYKLFMLLIKNDICLDSMTLNIISWHGHPNICKICMYANTALFFISSKCIAQMWSLFTFKVNNLRLMLKVCMLSLRVKYQSHKYRLSPICLMCVTYAKSPLTTFMIFLKNKECGRVTAYVLYTQAVPCQIPCAFSVIHSRIPLPQSLHSRSPLPHSCLIYTQEVPCHIPYTQEVPCKIPCFFPVL